MKKINKKAILATLLGALSSTTSFAMEGKAGNKNVQKNTLKGRAIDNADLFQTYHDKQMMILDKNDPNLNLSEEELDKIFRQMAEVEYISLDRGGMVKTREKLDENLEEFTKNKKYQNVVNMNTRLLVTQNYMKR